jgi:glycine cleavage system aminomethyltransferase T
MVAVEHTELRTELTVSIAADDDRAATVVPKPFVDPKKEIPKA